MKIQDAITCLKDIMTTGHTFTSKKIFKNVLYMAIRSLEMQKELAEYSGMDICQFVEDYDYEETDISEYEYENSVDDFLIEEAKGGKEE